MPDQSDLSDLSDLSDYSRNFQALEGVVEQRDEDEALFYKEIASNSVQQLVNEKSTAFSGEFEPVLNWPSALTSDAKNRRRRDSELERLKEGLLRPHLFNTRSPALRNQLRRAARETAALAWTTPCPLLVFPILFEESVAAAQRYMERQTQIREPAAARLRQNSERVAHEPAEVSMLSII